MVQDTGLFTLKGLLAVHERTDSALGTPYTRYDKLPLVIMVPETLTETVNADELVNGVAENVNVDPPFDVTGDMNEDAVDATAKSVDTPVVAPFPSATEIVQEIAIPAS